MVSIKKDKIVIERYFILLSSQQREILSPFEKIGTLNIKKESIKTFNIKENKINENLIKKRNNIINHNNIKKRNLIVLFIIIIFIIINLFYPTTTNIFHFSYQNSKITLKIKGIGENAIFGNETNNYFKGMEYLEKIYINGNETNTKEFRYYFSQINNIVELIFNDNLNNSINMFRGCSNITEINLSNFNTSQVTSMSQMFRNCFSLVSLNISNIDTSQVLSMSYMFCNCSSLKFLDISNINTIKVTTMLYMFNNCSSLVSLDLSSFNTSNVEEINHMFFNCLSLTSLNLSNFNTSKITDMSYMFNNCSSLVSLDLSSFVTSHVEDMLSMFYNCSSLTSLNISNFDTSHVTDMEYMFYNCENLEYINLYNFNEISLDNSISFYQKMFYNLPENVVICIKESINSDKIFPQIKNKTCFIIYCLDDWKSKQKKIINYTNECIESCNLKLQYKYEYNGKCYENCIYNYYIDNNNNYYCTSDALCPNEYPLLIEEKMKCIKYDIENIMKEILTKRNETEEISEEEEIKYYDYILKSIEDEFTSKYYNTSNLDNGKDEIAESEKMIITLTTSKNQKNNINKNMTSINLGQCEDLLRNYYNISQNEELYIKKIDVVQEGMKTLKVEYNVYSKLFGENLIKLNLTICEESKMIISIPIILKDSLDKLNSNSGYYNDICYTTTSEDGTDISLKDRQSEYIDKDRIVCQEDCEMSEYDYEVFKAKCLCKVKETPSSIADMKINKEKILQNFKDIKNIVNINFLVCYKKLFKKENIIKNIGFYLTLFIIIFHIIAIFVLCINQFDLLKKKIKDIIKEKYEYNIVKENKIEKNVAPKIYKNKKIKNNYFHKKDNRKNNKENNNIFPNPKDISDRIKININMNKRNSLKSDKLKKTINKTINISKYIDEEVNGLSYNLAVKYDKRTYFEYYISLLKTKHNLIFAICNNIDYNARIIKIDLFLIGFTIDYIVNALFYNDDTMHKIYKSKGEFDLETQLPITIYSYLITSVLNIPLNFLALSNDSILAFKKSKSNMMTRAKKLIKTLIIKFVFYFLISFIFLLFFWYYITMFCIIYKNTQIHLLKDTLISLCLSLFTPFIIYLVPGIFRIPSLNRSNRKCLYNFSNLLQSF